MNKGTKINHDDILCQGQAAASSKRLKGGWSGPLCSCLQRSKGPKGCKDSQDSQPNRIAMASKLLAMASYPRSDGLQPNYLNL